MDEEVVKILKMIEEGKVTAEEGAKLLEALKDEPATASRPPEAACCPGGETATPRCIGIYVTNGEHKDVKVKIPYNLARLVSKFAPKGVIKAEGGEFDLDELLKKIEECGCGEVLCVEAEDGKKVKICCE